MPGDNLSCIWLFPFSPNLFFGSSPFKWARSVRHPPIFSSIAARAPYGRLIVYSSHFLLALVVGCVYSIAWWVSIIFCF